MADQQLFRHRLGWWLMGLPCGIREPWQWWIRYGPYRWGAALMKDTNV